MRSTTKFWVRIADVSRLKHMMLQHLPVFQFNKHDLEGEVVMRVC